MIDTLFPLQKAPLTYSTLGAKCHQIAAQTEGFCDGNKSEIERIKEKGSISENLLNDLKNTGWLGLLIGKDYGGMGLGCLDRVVNVQGLSCNSPDLGAVLQIAQLGTGSIIEFGSDAQKRRWLPQLATGERICTISITEETSGSHVLGMKTSYVEKSDRFVLNGEKWFIGNSSIANLHVVYAKSAVSNKLSAFIVEGERHGVDNSESHQKLGLRAFPLGKLKLKDVEVPKENLLPSLEEGLRAAYYVIGHHGRPSLMSLALGIHQRILDLAYSFSIQRELYGKPIRLLDDVKNKIFEIYMRFEQSRQIAYEAAHQLDSGIDAYRVLAMAKYTCGDNACKAANVAAEIFGARAGIREYEVAQLYLDAMMTRPPSGTGDIQKKRILEEIFLSETQTVKEGRKVAV